MNNEGKKKRKKEKKKRKKKEPAAISIATLSVPAVPDKLGGGSTAKDMSMMLAAKGESEGGGSGRKKRPRPPPSTRHRAAPAAAPVWMPGLGGAAAGTFRNVPRKDRATINNQTASGQISPGTSSGAVAALISRANAEQASARMLAQKGEVLRNLEDIVDMLALEFDDGDNLSNDEIIRSRIGIWQAKHLVPLFENNGDVATAGHDELCNSNTQPQITGGFEVVFAKCVLDKRNSLAPELFLHIELKNCRNSNNRVVCTNVSLGVFQVEGHSLDVQQCAAVQGVQPNEAEQFIIKVPVHPETLSWAPTEEVVYAVSVSWQERCADKGKHNEKCNHSQISVKRTARRFPDSPTDGTDFCLGDMESIDDVSIDKDCNPVGGRFKIIGTFQVPTSILYQILGYRNHHEQLQSNTISFTFQERSFTSILSESFQKNEFGHFDHNGLAVSSSSSTDHHTIPLLFQDASSEMHNQEQDFNFTNPRALFQSFFASPTFAYAGHPATGKEAATVTAWTPGGTAEARVRGPSRAAALARLRAALPATRTAAAVAGSGIVDAEPISEEPSRALAVVQLDRAAPELLAQSGAALRHLRRAARGHRALALRLFHAPPGPGGGGGGGGGWAGGGGASAAAAAAGAAAVARRRRRGRGGWWDKWGRTDLLGGDPREALGAAEGGGGALAAGPEGGGGAPEGGEEGGRHRAVLVQTMKALEAERSVAGAVAAVIALGGEGGHFLN